MTHGAGVSLDQVSFLYSSFTILCLYYLQLTLRKGKFCVFRFLAFKCFSLDLIVSTSWSFVAVRFLFDGSCSDYKYYEYRLSEEEKALAQSRDSETSRNGLCIDIQSSVASYSLKFLSGNIILLTNDLLMHSFSYLYYDMLL